MSEAISTAIIVAQLCAAVAGWLFIAREARDVWREWLELRAMKVEQKAKRAEEDKMLDEYEARQWERQNEAWKVNLQ